MKRLLGAVLALATALTLLFCGCTTDIGSENSCPSDQAKVPDCFEKYLTPEEYGKLVGESTSEPVCSPKGTMIAYITPNEFEQATEVCVINLETKQKTTVIKKGEPSPTYAVKSIGWLDSNTLLAIVGYMYGTVSPGGTVYSVDVNTGEMKMLDIALKENEQIISIQPMGYEAIIEIAVFDESYENYNVKKDIFDMKFIDIPANKYDENSAYINAENKGDIPMLIVSPVTQDELAEAIRQSTDVLSIDKKGDIFLVIPRYITTEGEVSLLKIETVAYCEEEGRLLTEKSLYTAQVTDGFNMLIRANAGGTEPTIKITVSIGGEIYEHYM